MSSTCDNLTSINNALVNFYWQQTQDLANLKLDDLLQKYNFLFLLQNQSNAAKLVEQALDLFILDANKVFFSTSLYALEKSLIDEVEVTISKTEFLLENIRGFKHESKNKYYEQLGASSNRLTSEFINRFCDSRGTICWQRILQNISQIS